MSDVRALMKAQKNSKRIQHPYARYTNSGQLSCSLCTLNLKSEVLWPSHLTSKTHRNNLKRAKEEQEQTQSSLKRPAEDGTNGEAVGGEEDGTGKRRKLDREGEETPAASTSFLPAGFFDDPSQVPAPADEDTEAANGNDGEAMDEEWAAFEATLNAPEEEPEQPVASTSTGYTTAATITAQPVLFDDGEEGEEGKTAVDGQGNAAEADGEEEEDDTPKETEEERREREEREELMERIEIEEREQQEADERVDALKKRLLAVRAAKKTALDTETRPLNGTSSIAGTAIPSAEGGLGKASRKSRRNRW